MGQSRGLGDYALQSRVSDHLRGDAVQSPNCDTLQDRQMLECTDSLQHDVSGKQKLKGQITIKNTTGHTDTDNMWGPTDPKLDLKRDKY